jgi:6-pyruvoyltetrahydropterin/6-carboxytetrahydropterin synthase
MIIRKQFDFIGQHIVRNCSSERCKYSIHSHKYTVEVFFTADGLDNGQMVIDFGLTKGTIKTLIKAFDYTYTVWDKESDVFKEYIKNHCSRWIELPMSPSAEALSVMLFYFIDLIIKNTQFNNGECNPKLSSVSVHETTTGYAQCTNINGFKLTLSDFSTNIDTLQNLIQSLNTGTLFINPIAEQQV